MFDPAVHAEPIPAAEPVADTSVGPEPARIPPLERLTALFEIILCSGFPTQVLIILLLNSQGMRMTTAAGGLSPAFVFILSLADAILVVALVIFFLRTRGERVRDVLIGKRSVWGESLLGAALVPGVFLLVVIVLAVILSVSPSLHNVARNPLEAMLQTPRDAVIFSIVVMVAGGVREEVQRGFIVHRFDHYLGGGMIGVVVYSAAFGLGHLQQGYDAAIATGLLGTAWGTLYLVRRSIVAPMVSHAGFNLLQLLKFVALR